MLLVQEGFIHSLRNDHAKLDSKATMEAGAVILPCLGIPLMESPRCAPPNKGTSPLCLIILDTLYYSSLIPIAVAAMGAPELRHGFKAPARKGIVQAVRGPEAAADPALDPAFIEAGAEDRAGVEPAPSRGVEGGQQSVESVFARDTEGAEPEAVRGQVG